MKRNILKNFYVIIMALIVVIGVSYALFTANFVGKKVTTIDIKGLTFKYTEESQGINLSQAEPISDETGIASDNYFDFSILLSKQKTYSMTYNIYLIKDTSSTLDPKYVKVYLTDQNNSQLVAPTLFSALTTYPNKNNSYLLLTNTISVSESTPSTTHTYRLRMWLAGDSTLTTTTTTTSNKQTATVNDATFKVKVNVDNLTN